MSDLSKQQQIKSLIEEILIEEGYRPRRTEHDDIQFKSEGWSCLYDFDAGDEDFARLLIANMHDVPTGQYDATVKIVNAINAKLKVVKLFIVDDDSVWIGVEFLVASVPALHLDIIKRQISVAMLAARSFTTDIAPLLLAQSGEAGPAVHH